MSTPVTEWLPGMDITAGRLQYMLEHLAEAQSVTATGAIGDGSTDDAPAIQTALTAARDAGGGWIVVPPGTYLLASLPLRIYRNTRLTLLPGAEFRRGATGQLMINGDTGQSFGGWGGHSNITVEGGLWNMRGGEVAYAADSMCMSFGHCADITIRDLEIRDVAGLHAVELNSTKRATVQNCVFRGYNDPTGTRDFSEAVQLDLAKGSSYFGAFGPYDNTPCEDVSMKGCYVGASGSAGTTAWPRGIGSHSATITKYHRRIKVLACSFEGTLQYAVSAYNWEDAVVSSCNFQSCGSGVRLRSVISSDTEDTKLPDGTQTSASQTMRGAVVTGNTFRDGGSYDHAILAYGEQTGPVLNATISGNTIDSTATGESGIRVVWASRATVTWNTINNVGSTAISTDSMTQCNVSDNVIYNPTDHGITVLNSVWTNVADNNVRECGGNGLLVQSGADIHLRNNFIKAPSRSANGGFYGIRISTSSSSITLAGNKCRPFGSGNEASHGCSIATGTTLVHRYGNDWRGATWVTATYAEGTGTNSINSATDLIA